MLIGACESDVMTAPRPHAGLAQVRKARGPEVDWLGHVRPRPDHPRGTFDFIPPSTMGTPAHLSGWGQNDVYGDSKAVPPPGGANEGGGIGRGWRHV